MYLIGKKSLSLAKFGKDLNRKDMIGKNRTNKYLNNIDLIVMVYIFSEGIGFINIRHKEIEQDYIGKN